MNFSGILIGVLTFFLIGLFHPIVIYAEYYFGSRCWPVFLLVGILCMILSVRMQEILWSVSLGVLGVSCFWSIKELKEQKKEWQKDGSRSGRWISTKEESGEMRKWRYGDYR